MSLNTKYQLVSVSSPYQFISDAPDFWTSRRRNLTFIKNVDYQISILDQLFTNKIPYDHGTISEAVHQEVDATIECNEKVANQKYLRTNRNFLQNDKVLISFHFYIFKLRKLTHLEDDCLMWQWFWGVTHPGIFPDYFKDGGNILHRMTDDEYQDD